MFEKRKAEIAARLVELRGLIESCTDEQFTVYESEVNKLTEERATLEKRAATLAALNSGAATPAPHAVGNPLESRGADLSAMTPEQAVASPEYRSAYFRTLQGRELTEAEQRAYSTVENSGGAVMPETVAAEIVQKLHEYSDIIKYLKVYNIPGVLRVPIEDETGDAEIHVENGVITCGSDNLKSIELIGYGIVKLVQVSKELLAAAPAQFEEYVIDKTCEAIALKIEKIIFHGTGNGQPGGVAQGGMGTKGVYTNGKDLLTIPATEEVTEKHTLKIVACVKSGYAKRAIWVMPWTTFILDFYPLRNDSKNNIVTQVGEDFFILGRRVLFTDALDEGEGYFGDFKQIIANWSKNVSVEKSDAAGFDTFSVKYRGGCVFASKAVSGRGAFSKFKKVQAA